MIGKPRREVPGVDMRADEQELLVESLQLRTPVENRWVENDMFGGPDAVVLQAMLEHLRPARVIEVGSGYSTALMLDISERVLPDLTLTCVEPYADRLRARLRPGDVDRFELIELQVQDLPVETLVAGVGPGDILFIDSTHVLKTGSDVHYLFLHVFPRLPVGAVVHVHDVFWPFEYPDSWHEKGRHWTEDYLLHAFLLNNDSWEILLFSNWFWHCRSHLLDPGLRPGDPGSIWLRRKC